MDEVSVFNIVRTYTLKIFGADESLKTYQSTIHKSQSSYLCCSDFSNDGFEMSEFSEVIAIGSGGE